MDFPIIFEADLSKEDEETIFGGLVEHASSLIVGGNMIIGLKDWRSRLAAKESDPWPHTEFFV